MSIKQYIKRFRSYDGKIAEIASGYHIPASWLKLDCFLSKFVHGANPEQYIAFQFYKLSRRERRTFVTAGRSAKIERLFNDAPRSEKDIIGNKVLFNKSFAAYVQRDWLYLPEATEDEFRSFLSCHDKILVKPTDMTQGKGIRLLHKEEFENGVSDFFSKAQKDKLVLEAFIRQHPVLSTVNPSSVNTVRICTARDRAGEIHIIGASLRGGGAGSVVDNLHADGVQYSVDPETGLITRGGVKFDGERNVYFHPSTNVKMIGLQIPNWDIVVKTVKEAGKIPPNLRYIGWDVAVTETGCEIIEANILQGSNGMQQDGVGKYRKIMQYL